MATTPHVVPLHTLEQVVAGAGIIEGMEPSLPVPPSEADLFGRSVTVVVGILEGAKISQAICAEGVNRRKLSNAT